MRLSDYIGSLPRGERQKFRQKLADAHNCSVSLVRKWENWPPPEDWPDRKIKLMSRKHPAELVALKITEELTGNSVTRLELRPECWSEEA
jgi:hypothetical protein